MKKRIVELGCPGHFIGSSECEWRRHTQIGDRYRVSTVGDYFPYGVILHRETLGVPDDSFFETMVFETLPNHAYDNEGCGCHEIKNYSELECERYATAGEAQAGHERYVRKYARLEAKK